MHEVTHHGLNCWARSLFEKFGWILLAYTKGFPSEIEHYIDNIKDIHIAIKDKIKNTVNQDSKNDLIILKNNIESLMFFSNLMKNSLDEHYSNNNIRNKLGNSIKHKIPKKDIKKKVLKKSMDDMARVHKQK